MGLLWHTHTRLTVAWRWVSHPFRQLDTTTHQHAAEWEVRLYQRQTALLYAGIWGRYLNSVVLNNIASIQNCLFQTCGLCCVIQAAAVYSNDLCTCVFVHLSKQTNGISRQVAKSHAAVWWCREEEESIAMETHLQVSHAIKVWAETTQ